MTTYDAHEPGNEPGCQHKQHALVKGRVRIEAPADLDPLLLAQVIVGEGWLLKAERIGNENPFAKHRPLAQLYTLAVRVYRAQIKEMLAAIDRYVEKNTDLMKASKRKRPLFTVAQLQELVKIIRDFHSGIAIGIFGRSAAAPEEVQRLVDLKVLPKEALNIIDDAWAYGQLLSQVQLQVTKGRTMIPPMTLEAVKKRLKAKPLPLTSDEEFAREWVRMHAATQVRGLGNRVSQDFETMAIEADRALRQRMQSAIRDSLDENIERREAWRKLKSDLGHKTDDWARDFGRIAATEKQQAMQEGLAQSLIKREGEDVLVAKVPAPSACPHCVRLHLRGARPRVFKLSDLQANGTNVGRKARDWKPVVGPVHPWCECALVHVPDGWGFDESGTLVPRRTRKAWRFERDLRKALSYGDSVPERGVTVRVGDPEKVAVINDVLARTPKTLFSRKTGVTLITTDHPTQNSHLDDHDLAYWTGNEIRLMQNLPIEKLRSVLEHEMGHVPNVYLMHRLGGVEKVKAWHEKLYAIAQEEGFVTEYASKLPIECAAEVTRMYLYDRMTLMRDFPRQFTFVHRYYRPLIRPVSQKRRAVDHDRASTRMIPKEERLDV